MKKLILATLALAGLSLTGTAGWAGCGCKDGGCKDGGCASGGCASGGCASGGCASGGCASGGCASGGCASGGCASGGCASGGCASGGCASGGCASGGCTSGGCSQACAAPCTKMACVYEDRPCIRYKPVWSEREVLVCVNKLIQHEVTEHQTVCINVPVWSEVARCRTVCVQVPREVCKHVTCTRMVETCCVDPCTGCSHKVCKPETYCKEVKETVMETVQQQQPYTERVCTYHQEQQTVEIKKMVCQFVPTTEKKIENCCTMVPYATTERVPTCKEITALPYVSTTSCCGGCGGCGAATCSTCGQGGCAATSCSTCGHKH